jgi:hypothetical protein
MNVEDFTSKVPDSQAESRTTIETIARAVVAFRQRANDIRRDKDMTPLGHAKKIAEMAGSPREFLRHMRANLAKDVADVKARRDDIDLPSRSDKAADEIRAMEIRTYLRGLSRADAARAVLEGGREIAMAALHAPRQLSGLDVDLYNRLRDTVIEELQGPELLALRDEEVANEQVRIVLDIADQQIASEVNLGAKPGQGDAK